MTKLKYCAKCVMPNTKPDLFFDKDGVCDACRSAEKKNAIDWAGRKKQFEEILNRYRNKQRDWYDCIVPVSGGKDSHYQTYVMKKLYGMNPLCVHFEPTCRSVRGLDNVENLRNAFGVDMIEFRKNPVVYKKMVIEGFKRVGDNEWPNHLGIFTIPIQVAVKFNIPLIIWGENSQLEYGGPAAASEKNYLDRRWLEEFGGLLGNRLEDMIGVDGIAKEDLVAYRYPSDDELKRAGVTGLFLGYFFKWDAREQTKLMIDQFGFKFKNDGPVEGTFTNYENLDERTVGLHDYLKFTKYGFGRATDHACIDIRNGRITRDEGIRLVQLYDGKYPYYAVQSFMEYANMPRHEVDAVIDRFTNKQIFAVGADNAFTRDIAGNLVLDRDFTLLAR